MKLRHFRLTRYLIKLTSLARRHFLKVAFFFLICSFILLSTLGIRFLRRHQVQPSDLISFLGSSLESVDQTGGLTNFLILGVRGGSGDSPNLTDTIIVVSYDHTDKNASLISVPRDLWVESLQDKINTAYSYGEEASPGAGIRLAQASILEDLGLPIHYTAVINFDLFQKAIDLVGGVDVDVNPGFIDSEFPIPGKENSLPISSRYETIVFSQGMNHFDGQTALKFVRSRHSEGNEGTDFARSRRQQQIISALRQKIITPAFFLDQVRLDAFISIVSDHLVTNIPRHLFPAVARLALDLKDSPLRTVSLSTLPDEYGVTILYHPNPSKYLNRWVLMPKDNNWGALKQYIANRLLNKQ